MKTLDLETSLSLAINTLRDIVEFDEVTEDPYYEPDPNPISKTQLARMASAVETLTKLRALL